MKTITTITTLSLLVGGSFFANEKASAQKGVSSVATPQVASDIATVATTAANTQTGQAVTTAAQKARKSQKGKDLRTVATTAAKTQTAKNIANSGIVKSVTSAVNRLMPAKSKPTAMAPINNATTDEA